VCICEGEDRRRGVREGGWDVGGVKGGVVRGGGGGGGDVLLV